MEYQYFFDNAKVDWNIPEEFYDAIRWQLSYQFYSKPDNIGRINQNKNIKIKSRIKLASIESTLYKDYYFSKKNLINLEKVLSFGGHQINDSIKGLGFPISSPYGSCQPNAIRDKKLISVYSKLFLNLYDITIDKIISGEFYSLWYEFRKGLIEIFKGKKIRSILTMNDTTFFQNTYINAAKKAGIPSAVFLHGFPNPPNNITNNRADYLLVYGEYFKKIYLELGLDENKIKIVGHPRYRNLLPHNDLRFSFDKVVVLTKPGIIEAPDIYYWNSDVGTSILYLQYIEHVLKRFGINKAVVRPHPSENILWYQRYIDNSFYKLDHNANIFDTLKNSTLVIGPTSTAFFDTLFEGIHYCIFEPIGKDGTDLLGIRPLCPFNGEDPRIPVAKNEQELFESLTKKRPIDLSFWREYINPEFTMKPYLDAIS